MKKINKNAKNVSIEIKSVRDGYETSLFVSDAKMAISDKDEYLIEFDGTEMIGIDGERISFLVDGQKKVVMTTGNKVIFSQLILEKGVRHHSQYMDEFDEPVIVGVLANNIKSNMNSSGGKVEIRYTIELNHSMASDNLMSVNVITQ